MDVRIKLERFVEHETSIDDMLLNPDDSPFIKQEESYGEETDIHHQKDIKSEPGANPEFHLKYELDEVKKLQHQLNEQTIIKDEATASPEFYLKREVAEVKFHEQLNEQTIVKGEVLPSGLKKENFSGTKKRPMVSRLPPKNFWEDLKKAQIKKVFECKDCPKSFTQYYTYLLHSRLHTGEKPYECGVCNKKFRRNTELNNHFKIHSSEKPFLCTNCDKEYFCSSYLKSHIKKKHSSKRKVISL